MEHGVTVDASDSFRVAFSILSGSLANGTYACWHCAFPPHCTFSILSGSLANGTIAFAMLSLQRIRTFSILSGSLANGTTVRPHLAAFSYTFSILSGSLANGTEAMPEFCRLIASFQYPPRIVSQWNKRLISFWTLAPIRTFSILRGSLANGTNGQSVHRIGSLGTFSILRGSLANGTSLYYRVATMSVHFQYPPRIVSQWNCATITA